MSLRREPRNASGPCLPRTQAVGAKWRLPSVVSLEIGAPTAMVYDPDKNREYDFTKEGFERFKKEISTHVPPPTHEIKVLFVRSLIEKSTDNVKVNIEETIDKEFAPGLTIKKMARDIDNYQRYVEVGNVAEAQSISGLTHVATNAYYSVATFVDNENKSYTVEMTTKEATSEVLNQEPRDSRANYQLYDFFNDLGVRSHMSYGKNHVLGAFILIRKAASVLIDVFVIKNGNASEWKKPTVSRTLVTSWRDQTNEASQKGIVLFQNKLQNLIIGEDGNLMMNDLSAAVTLLSTKDVASKQMHVLLAELLNGMIFLSQLSSVLATYGNVAEFGEVKAYVLDRLSTFATSTSENEIPPHNNHPITLFHEMLTVHNKNRIFTISNDIFYEHKEPKAKSWEEKRKRGDVYGLLTPINLTIDTDAAHVQLFLFAKLYYTLNESLSKYSNNSWLNNYRRSVSLKNDSAMETIITQLQNKNAQYSSWAISALKRNHNDNTPLQHFFVEDGAIGFRTFGHRNSVSSHVPLIVPRYVDKP